MIFKTALGAGDLFKAVGGTGGILHELDSMTPHIRTPIYHAVGTLDDRFIKAPFTELPLVMIPFWFIWVALSIEPRLSRIDPKIHKD